MTEKENSRMLQSQDFFNLKDFDHQEIFSKDEAVWTTLDRLKDYLATFFQESWPLATITGQVDKPLVIYKGEVRDDLEVKATGPKNSIQVFMKGETLEDVAVILPGAYLFNDTIIIGSGTVVEPGALIKGPTVIGNDTEVRQGAYLRGDCLVGNGCVVGHTTEVKGSIMLDGAKAGHFAYIGDSILGREVNLGAGTKLANLKVVAGSVSIRAEGKKYDTGRRKLGAILGDKTETGCNSVTSPGTMIGPHSIVLPGVSVSGGYYPARTSFIPSQGSLKIYRRKGDALK
jgi:acetyltransferase-like isoleucine patch superfamily enzyme